MVIIMGLKSLNQFQRFDLVEFLKDKRLAYLKATAWEDNGAELGSKVTIQIVEDRTRYSQPGKNNFGEQITVKVRGVAPSAFSQLRPLTTEVIIKDVERAVVYGEYRNQLSIIGTVAVKEAPAAR